MKGVGKTYHCASEVSRPGDGLNVLQYMECSRVVWKAEVIDFECGLGTPRNSKDVRAPAATFRIACRAASLVLL